MHVVRWWLARHRNVHRFAVLALALAAARLAAPPPSPAEERLVPLTRGSLPVGHVVQEQDVEWRRVPARTVPRAAVAAHPVGRVVATPLVPGEVLLAARLGDGTRLPPGTRGLAIPVPGAAPRLLPGDTVDVLASFDTGDEAVPTVTVATGAVVLEAGDGAVTLAVAAADVARVAFAVTRGVVVLALTAPAAPAAPAAQERASASPTTARPTTTR